MKAPAVLPLRRLGLGLRLGFLATLVVTGIMAALTGTQLALELRAESHDRETRLAKSLAPLVAELQAATTYEEIARAVDRFHTSYVLQGDARHHLAVVEASGRIVIGRVRSADRMPDERLTVRVPIVAPVLGTKPVAIVLTDDDSGYAATRTRRWWAWAVHVGVTAFLILIILFVVIRREVTGPLDRLLMGVRKMERGYWDDMPDPGGAWEIRWLGHRFKALGQELGSTVEHVVAAQRRAYAVEQRPQEVSVPPSDGTRIPPGPATGPALQSRIHWLDAQLEHLSSGRPDDPATYALARLIWDHYALQAERLGQPELCAALEDAALRILEPDEFLVVSGWIAPERGRLEALARSREEHLRRALAARGVPVVDICHRIKHAAGVWKKLRQKDLDFEQIHDLVALRLVVPTETDCYHALGVVHDVYTPIVLRFKDYIVAPKPNGYRSLHLSVRDAERSVFEIQIRSIAMHRHAEQGTAAHAAYKDASRIDSISRRASPWRRLVGLLELHWPRNRPDPSRLYGGRRRP